MCRSLLRPSGKDDKLPSSGLIQWFIMNKSFFCLNLRLQRITPKQTHIYSSNLYSVQQYHHKFVKGILTYSSCWGCRSWSWPSVQLELPQHLRGGQRSPVSWLPGSSWGRWQLWESRGLWMRSTGTVWSTVCRLEVRGRKTQHAGESATQNVTQLSWSLCYGIYMGALHLRQMLPSHIMRVVNRFSHYLVQSNKLWSVESQSKNLSWWLVVFCFHPELRQRQELIMRNQMAMAPQILAQGQQRLQGVPAQFEPRFMERWVSGLTLKPEKVLFIGKSIINL